MTMLKEQPEFDVSEDQAPDATFSDGGKSSGESKGIVSIMTMLKEDLEDEVANGIKNEEESQTTYAAQRGAAEKLIASLEEKKTNLEEARADTDTKIGNAETLKQDTQALLDGKNEELAAMKPNCDWILKNFEIRRDRRKSEMEGLMEAKSLMSGSGALSHLQTNAKAFDDEAFGKLTFLRKRD